MLFSLPMDTKKKNLIPLNIAARKYGVPRKWLADEALSGRLPSLIAGGSILFDESLLTSELLKRAQSHRQRTIQGEQNDD